METRRLGDTGQESSILTFGAIALDRLDQRGADQAVELMVQRGVNHVDVAPTYGDAEVKLAPKLGEYRDDLFLGCKTQERSYDGAWEKLEASLDRLDTDSIDLHQFHAVISSGEIDEIVGEDGALRAYREAQDEGLIEHIGLTSHGHPDVILEAIDRIDDLESVMFPMNHVVAGTDDGAYAYERVIERATEEGLGMIGIKAFARRPWPDELPDARAPYATWYEPRDTSEEIEDALNFALSQGLTTITNAGDPKLLAMILDAADRFEELGESEQTALIEAGRGDDSPVPADFH